MKYDTWLQDGKAFEDYHGLNREQEAERELYHQREIERDIDEFMEKNGRSKRYIEPKKAPGQKGMLEQILEDKDKNKQGDT